MSRDVPVRLRGRPLVSLTVLVSSSPDPSPFGPAGHLVLRVSFYLIGRSPMPTKFDDSLQHHEFFPGGHLTFARCEPCMYGSHYEEVTWHSWAGPDDTEGMDADRLAEVAKQKCACDCAGPKS